MYIHFHTSIRNRVSHDQFIWNSVMASSTPFPPFPVILSIPLLSVPCNIHSNLPVICGHTYIIKIPCTVCSRLSLSRIRNHSCGMLNHWQGVYLLVYNVHSISLLFYQAKSACWSVWCRMILLIGIYLTYTHTHQQMQDVEGYCTTGLDFSFWTNL